MTREQKLSVHLEHVIFADLPQGTRLTAAEVELLCARATPEQHARARERALTRSPMLVGDERDDRAEGVG